MLCCFLTHSWIRKEWHLAAGDFAITPVPTLIIGTDCYLYCAAPRSRRYWKTESSSAELFGSAQHEVVDKAVEATKIAKEMTLWLMVKCRPTLPCTEVGAEEAPVLQCREALIVPSFKVGKYFWQIGSTAILRMARPETTCLVAVLSKDVYRMTLIQLISHCSKSDK